MKRKKKREIRRWKSEKYSHAATLFVRATLLLFVTGMLMLFFSRLSVLWAYGENVRHTSFLPDLLRAFAMGARFDAKVMATLLLPLLLFPLVYTFTEKRFAPRFIRLLWVVFATLILVSLFVVCVVDFFYFSFFHTHFDATAWGLIEDDTSAVLHSIWNDFPVIRFFLVTLLFTLLAGFFMYFLVHCPNRAKYPSYFIKRFCLLVLLLACSFVMARGTFSTLPLRAMHLNVSTNPFINQLANNPPFALYEVVAHAQENRLELNTQQILKQWGFSSEQEVLEAYIGSSLTSPMLYTALIDSTACNDSLKRTPPHVVVLQMESMPTYYMGFDHGMFDLLGALKEELPNGYWFKNTLSGGSGTLASLEALLFGIVQGPVGQSIHYRTPLPYSAAKVFQKQGYTTSYVSGQRLGWRNMNNFLKEQGFDRVEGDVDLQEKVSRVPQGTWGIHDEALFERILQILLTAQTPQLVYGMSISHHSPYDTPQNEWLTTMRVPDSVWQKVDMPEEVARKSFAAFRYQTDHLGKFLKEVYNSSLAENTIVVFTGDHTIKQNMKNCDDPLTLYGVPIVFFLPKKMREQDSIDLNQYASHNDIFPTLFHLALSGAKYLRTGRNLFAAKQTLPQVALYDRKLLLAPNVSIPLSLQTSEGMKAADNMSHDTETTHRLYDSLSRFGRAYYAAMECFVAHELKKDLPLSTLFEPLPCVDTLASRNE